MLICLVVQAIETEKLPNYLYKILTTPPEEQLPSIFPLSPSDAADGFIHLSTADQVIYVASRRYNNASELGALKLNYKWMMASAADIRWEISGNSSYPHLYGDLIKEMVFDWKMWTKETNESWREVIQKDSWLDGTLYSSAGNQLLARKSYPALLFSFYLIHFSLFK